jgi:hypothetical protein
MDWYTSLNVTRWTPASKSKREQALTAIITKWALYRRLKAIPLSLRSPTVRRCRRLPLKQMPAEQES